MQLTVRTFSLDIFGREHWDTHTGKKNIQTHTVPRDFSFQDKADKGHGTQEQENPKKKLDIKNEDSDGYKKEDVARCDLEGDYEDEKEPSQDDFYQRLRQLVNNKKE